MKKHYIFLYICVLTFFFSAQAQSLDINGVTYAVDTLENHKVGPGTNYVSVRMTSTSHSMNVFFITSDLKNPYVEIRAAIGRDSIYGGEPVSAVAKRKSTEGAFYFAGTNGDFYDTGKEFTGYPISGNMIDGEIAKIPGSRNVFVMDDQKRPDIGIMSYSGTVKFGELSWAINSVNHLRGADQLVLFNQYNGKITRTNPYGTEVLVELLEGNTWGSNKVMKAKVLKIEKGVGSMPIPKGKVVLSGHGTAEAALSNLSVNDLIDIELGLSVNENAVSNYIQMTGGDNYATMLLNGVVEQSSVWNELHPRTGLGFSQNRDTVVFCVVDGRSGVSNGATTKQLAELMKSAGAYTAFNMDGGGSSTMYVAEYGKAVNKTSDGTERSVSNSIFVVSNAPTDSEVGMIKPYKTTISLPKYGEHTPQFYGYNQYETLLDSDLEGVVLSCPESLGTIVGSKFIATGDKPGNITATYNGKAVTTIAVNFVPVTDIKIRLDSAIVDNRKDYPIEVVGVTATSESAISPIALTWTVEDPTICEVVNGAVKALKNGSTKITGKINDVVDEILIHAQIPASSTMIGDSMFVSDWDMKISNFMKEVDFSNTNIPSHWEYGSAVNFKSSTGRAPYITLSNATSFYGLPDTIKFVMNIGDMAVDNAIFTFNANDSQKSTITLTSFEANKDFSLTIPVDQLFDTSDKGIYPIWFDNVKFNIKASGMTAGQTYALGVKEIILCYKDVVSSSVGSIRTDFFQVYPNPINKGSDFFITLQNDDTTPLSIQIFDMTGRRVYSSKQDILSTTPIEISTKDLNSGVYFLRVSQNDKINSTKIIVGS